MFNDAKKFNINILNMSSKITSKITSKIPSKIPSKKTSKFPSKKLSRKLCDKKTILSNVFSLKNFYRVKILSEKKLEEIAIIDQIACSIYKKIKNKIIPEINKLGIKTFIVPLPITSDGIIWGDFAYDYIKEKYKIEPLDITHMYFVFYLNNVAKKLLIDKYINVGFSELDLDTKKKIINIFYKYLPNNYLWNGENNEYMKILFKKNKDIKHIDIKKLK